MAGKFAGLMAVLALLLGSGVASAHEWGGEDYRGSGWLGSPWGGTFRRDPIVGVYGYYNAAPNPYRSYRNDRGCYRVLPVETREGLLIRKRVFVCDY